MTLGLLCLLILVGGYSIIRAGAWLKRSSNKFPPGPYPLPIIGNLLELGKNPHRSLAKLSETYGPLMYLKLGSQHTIVVSSPAIAKEVLQKHDQACSGRSIPDAVQALDHHEWSFAWTQIGTRWRKFRKICREEMFSKSRLVSTEPHRMEKIKQMREYLNECCDKNRAVNIGETAFMTSFNMMSNTLFSMDFADYHAGSFQEIIRNFGDLMRTVGATNLSDYFSIFKRFDPQGIRRRSGEYFGKFFAIFDEIISEKLRSRDASCLKKNDFLEVLIEISQNDDSYLSRNEINHLLLDLVIAGVDSTTNAIEWAMTELLRNPEVLSKAKDELEAVVGNVKHVEESDIPRLPYLNAVIKETLRIRPPGPFLVPHEAESDVEINGYTIPKGARILFNIWAIGRDSKVWSNPERFEPERFEESKIDYRGKDFELIPFSSGRRMCPGLPFAHVVVHLMVASLIHRFDWKIDAEMRSQSLDVTEKFGLAFHKAKPLMAFPRKC